MLSGVLCSRTFGASRVVSQHYSVTRPSILRFKNLSTRADTIAALRAHPSHLRLIDATPKAAVNTCRDQTPGVATIAKVICPSTWWHAGGRFLWLGRFMCDIGTVKQRPCRDRTRRVSVLRPGEALSQLRRRSCIASDHRVANIGCPGELRRSVPVVSSALRASSAV